MSDKSYVPASGKTYLIKHSPQGKFQVQEGSGKPSELSLNASAERIDHQTLRVILERAGKARQLFWIYSVRNKRVLAWPGGSIELDALDLTEGAGAGGGKLKPLKLTMPGKVLTVKVKEGDTVEAGQGLVIVEAMKMENLLLAPGKAKVLKVHVKAGDRLESGATLITFGPAE
jgi:biotin carboxyl carrier protein